MTIIIDRFDGVVRPCKKHVWIHRPHKLVIECDYCSEEMGVAEIINHPGFDNFFHWDEQPSIFYDKVYADRKKI